MNIRYRITLLFTVLVTAILLLLCTSVYYFSSLNREKDFRTRLRNRALTTVNLLVRVQGIDKELLNRIDKSTFVALHQKSVVVYDDANHVIYNYTDSNTTTVTADSKILAKARSKNKEEYFSSGYKDAVALHYQDDTNQHVVIAAAYDMSGYEKLAQLKVILLLSLVTGMVVTFISGLIFSVRLVLPIKKITNEVKDISSQNLSTRIDLHEPKDELYELSLTFNKLLNSLQESFEIQRRFIANASHELSTPLTSIYSQLEITLQNTRSAEEYKSVINSVYDDVKNLIQLTKSLLELAKASGTSDGMELSLIRIDELLMRLPIEMRKANDKYAVELFFDTFPDEEDKLLVFGNADLLYSAVKNIVVNACKYSQDGKAGIALHFTHKGIQLHIKDNGPGIEKSEMELIFQPFYRTAGNYTVQGFGLGLPLASRIISLHKGRINIKTQPGQGSEFIIYLPLASIYHTL